MHVVCFTKLSLNLFMGRLSRTTWYLYRQELIKSTCTKMNLWGAANSQEFEAGKTAISVQLAIAAAAVFYSANQGNTDLTGFIYNRETLENFHLASDIMKDVEGVPLFDTGITYHNIKVANSRIILLNSSHAPSIPEVTVQQHFCFCFFVTTV